MLTFHLIATISTVEIYFFFIKAFQLSHFFSLTGRHGLLEIRVKHDHTRSPVQNKNALSSGELFLFFQLSS